MCRRARYGAEFQREESVNSSDARSNDIVPMGCPVSRSQTPLFWSLAQGIGANAISQIVNIVALLLSVPLFLAYWDREQYGIWLMLIAVPVYFQMLDGGFVAAAMNEIVMRHARGDQGGAQQAFSAALGLTTAVIATAAFISVLLITFAPIQLIDVPERRTSLLLLVAAALLNLYSGLFDAIFRCANRYAQGVLIMQLVRIAELIAVAIALSLGARYLAVAAVIAAVQILHLSCVQRYLCRLRPTLAWKFGTWDPPTFFPMIRPGLAWMGFRIGDGIAIQGAILAVGSAFGGGATVTFYAMRTLSRLLFQLVASFGNALWPEVTRLHAAGELTVVKRMVFRFGLISISLMIGGTLVLLLLAPFILNLWTHGRVEVDWPLLCLLMAQVILLGAWYIPRIYLAAINRVGWLSLWAILLYASALSLGILYSSLLGIPGLVGALVAAETVLMILAWRTTLKQMRR